MRRDEARLERLRVPRVPLVVHAGRARSGLEVLVAPMPGFSGVHAALAARFGSRDTTLPDGTELPPGVAHFLEHEMFQKKAGDLFDHFEALGASANAYTTASSTVFLFSCTDGVEANLETLLGSVATLEIDEADVARERAIIAQEIAMYADDPAWRGYFELMGALYHRHPVRSDIAGTLASLERIDRAGLGAAHETWYGARNLVLVVAGDVDPPAILEQVEAAGPRRRGARAPLRRIEDEPPGVRRREAGLGLGITRPTVYLGLKERPLRRRAGRVRRHVLTSMVLDLLFADGGRLEAELYRDGIVDDSLSAAYEAEEDFAHAFVTAEVDDVPLFRRRLEAGLRRAAERGFARRELDRARRRAVGRYLRVFNAPETVAQWLLHARLEGVALDARWHALRVLDVGALERRLRALLALPRAWVVVHPGVVVEPTPKARRIPARCPPLPETGSADASR